MFLLFGQILCQYSEPSSRERKGEGGKEKEREGEEGSGRVRKGVVGGRR